MHSERQDPTRLHVVADGDGAPVVFVNGLFQTVESWRGYVPALSRYFKMVRYDQRNQGASPRKAAISIDEHVSDLHSIAESLDSPQVGLVAHSFGCRIAMDYAARHPERVSRILLISANTTRLSARYRLIFSSWLKALESSADGLSEFVDALVPWIYSARFPVEHQGIVRNVYRQFAERPKEPLLANMKAALDAYDDARRSAREAPFAGPTRVLQGEQDYITPASELAPLMALLPTGMLEVLPGGHALALEATSRVEYHLIEHFG